MKFWGEKLRIAWMEGERSLAIEILGAPMGESIDLNRLQTHVSRRSPGKAPWTASRYEPEKLRILEGIRNGRIVADRIVITVEDDIPKGSDHLRGIPRPGSADISAYHKYGPDADLGESGPFGSVRMTLICAAGGIALQLLEKWDIHVGAHIASIGLTRDHRFDPMRIEADTLRELRQKAFPVLDDSHGMQMMQRILREKAAGNSIGGQIEACVIGLPKGLGGPWFEGLEGKFAQGLYAIPAIKGVEFGNGFGVSALTGSQNNDPIAPTDAGVQMTTNHAGGVLGGMSTGLPLIVRAAFKPTPGIAVEQETVDLETGERVVLLGRLEDENRPRGRHEKPFEPVPAKSVGARGRHEVQEETHDVEPSDGFLDLRTGETVRVVELGEALDPCVVPRAVPIVESVLALSVLDCLKLEEQPMSPEALREEIAGIDRELLECFARRMEVSARIGDIKQAEGLPVLDAAQEERVYDRVRATLPEELQVYGVEWYRTLIELSKAYRKGDKGE